MKPEGIDRAVRRVPLSVLALAVVVIGLFQPLMHNGSTGDFTSWLAFLVAAVLLVGDRIAGAIDSGRRSGAP